MKIVSLPSRVAVMFSFLLATFIVSQFASRSHSEEAKPATIGPQYNDKGELKLPADYRTWVFVGSNLGLEYRDTATDKTPPAKKEDKPKKTGNFHNVYIDPVSFAQYMKTGVFPEKTMLVLDVYKAEQGEPQSIVSEGLFPGKQTGVALAVKNSARPDGSKTEWAYYDFKPDQTAAKAFPDKACYDCHLEHGSDDNVWVQFYPTLKRRTK